MPRALLTVPSCGRGKVTRVVIVMTSIVICLLAIVKGNFDDTQVAYAKVTEHVSYGTVGGGDSRCRAYPSKARPPPHTELEEGEVANLDGEGPPTRTSSLLPVSLQGLPQHATDEIGENIEVVVIGSRAGSPEALVGASNGQARDGAQRQDGRRLRGVLSGTKQGDSTAEEDRGSDVSWPRPGQLCVNPARAVRGERRGDEQGDGRAGHAEHGRQRAPHDARRGEEAAAAGEEERRAQGPHREGEHGRGPGREAQGVGQGAEAGYIGIEGDGRIAGGQLTGIGGHVTTKGVTVVYTPLHTLSAEPGTIKNWLTVWGTPPCQGRRPREEADGNRGIIFIIYLLPTAIALPITQATRGASQPARRQSHENSCYGDFVKEVATIDAEMNMMDVTIATIMMKMTIAGPIRMSPGRPRSPKEKRCRWPIGRVEFRSVAEMHYTVTKAKGEKGDNLKLGSNGTAT